MYKNEGNKKQAPAMHRAKRTIAPSNSRPKSLVIHHALTSPDFVERRCGRVGLLDLDLRFTLGNPNVGGFFLEGFFKGPKIEIIKKKIYIYIYYIIYRCYVPEVSWYRIRSPLLPTLCDQTCRMDTPVSNDVYVNIL